jgi:hypothetical protein
MLQIVASLTIVIDDCDSFIILGPGRGLSLTASYACLMSLDDILSETKDEIHPSYIFFKQSYFKTISGIIFGSIFILDIVIHTIRDDTL